MSIPVVAVVNQKGGVAKTTTTANLGATLASAGKRVLLVDLDPQTSLTVALSVEERSDLYSEGVLPVPTSLPGIDLVPGSFALMQSEFALYSARRWDCLRELLLEAAPRDGGAYEAILIDCPPSISGSTTNAIVAASCVLLPSTLDGDVLDKLDTSLQLIELLSGLGLPITRNIRGLVTRYRPTVTQKRLFEIAERRFAEIWLTTRIRESATYVRASLERIPACRLATRNSAPVTDHLSLARELGLLP